MNRNALPDIHRIAVWNTAFLGDAVLTLPLVQSLRAAYPETTLDFYIRKGLAGLFTAHPAISGVFEYDKNGGQKGLLALNRFSSDISKRGYDLWVSAHQSLRSGIVAMRSGAPLRIGYASSWPRGLFYTKTVDRRFAELAEIERLLELLKPLDIQPASFWPELHLPDAVLEKSERYFRDNFGGPVLGMHPGSVWGSKRWPAEYFAVIGALAVKHGASVIVFSGPGEEKTAEVVTLGISRFAAEVESGSVRNLGGKLSLPEVAAFMGLLDCCLTNDSGPMHLAWCQRTPVVALFGPTVRALGFAPRGEKTSLLEVEGLTCRPCGLHGPQRCPLKHHRCMTRLTPEMVWPSVKAALFGSAGGINPDII